MSLPKYKVRSLLGQHLIMLPERTLFWREEKLLIVADPHFGKAQIFRENSISIPAGTTADDLERLSHQIDQLQPRKLLFRPPGCSSAGVRQFHRKSGDPSHA